MYVSMMRTLNFWSILSSDPSRPLYRCPKDQKVIKIKKLLKQI